MTKFWTETNSWLVEYGQSMQWRHLCQIIRAAFGKKNHLLQRMYRTQSMKMWILSCREVDQMLATCTSWAGSLQATDRHLVQYGTEFLQTSPCSDRHLVPRGNSTEVLHASSTSTMTSDQFSSSAHAMVTNPVVGSCDKSFMKKQKGVVSSSIDLTEHQTLCIATRNMDRGKDILLGQMMVVWDSIVQTASFKWARRFLG